MSVDFIHCNNCLILPSNGVQYYLTQCAKIYCQKCCQLLKDNCSKCAPNMCQNILLDNNIKPEIELCFRDLSHSFKKLQKVETFQKSQRINLINKLFDENKQLKNELISQKELIDKLQNENKSFKQMIEENRSNDTTVDNQSIHSLSKLKKKEKPNKPLFSDLFASGNQNQFNLNNNNNQIQLNNPLVNRNVARDQQMASDTSFRKPLSPLQSLRGSRITLKPNYSLRDNLGLAARPTNAQQLINTSLNPNSINATPMTIASNSSLGSFSTTGTTITPYNRNLAQRTPSTGYSSIPSLSSLTFGDRNRLTRKVYPFSPNDTH